MRILFVCSGNTCRSPMAEGLLRRAVEREGWSDVTVESAGTGAFDGAPVSEGAYLAGLEAGIDLSGHRSRPLTRELVRGATMILTMSRSHLARVEEMGGAGKSGLLSAFGAAGDPAEIRDPFGSGIEVYRDTLGQLTGLVDGVVRHLAARKRE